MEYEQFFPNMNNADKCVEYVQVTAYLLIITFLIIECFRYPRNQNLRAENETFRKIVTKSIDRQIVRLLKNGYHSDEEDEE